MHSVSMFTEILDIVVAIASSSYSLWKLYRGPCAPAENHDKVYSYTCDCNRQANKKHHSYYILAGNV